jgi:hypothetical protein
VDGKAVILQCFGFALKALQEATPERNKPGFQKPDSGNAKLAFIEYA